jgi:hypothetical protein
LLSFGEAYPVSPLHGKLATPTIIPYLIRTRAVLNYATHQIRS